MEPQYSDIRQMLLDRMSGNPQPVLNQATSASPQQVPAPQQNVQQPQQNLGKKTTPKNPVHGLIKTNLAATGEEYDPGTRGIARALIQRLVDNHL